MRAMPWVIGVLGSLWALGAPCAGLPVPVLQALRAAVVPPEAMSVVVVAVPGAATPRLSHLPAVPRNPASVMKLVTSAAALDLLGPGFVWTTPVYLGGAVQDGVLRGDLFIRGQGDPKLVLERLWLLLRQVRALGIHTVQGDIVLDHSAFEPGAQDPAAFDGEPLRPYNAAPDALLVNYKSLLLRFVPDTGRAQARVLVLPPLAGVQVPDWVSMAAGPCSDYRAALKADFSDPLRLRFLGAYPAACGEKTWPLAYADPARFAARALEALWAELGGRLMGSVRDGSVPKGLQAVFEWTSPSLGEVLRDMNKFSNNVMAEQLFLTLSWKAQGRGTPADARERLHHWWAQRLAGVEEPQWDNGSGLSRQGRITAQALASLLQMAFAAGWMPELMASLPLAGVDGTLTYLAPRARPYSAHLKTGSLQDVQALAGYLEAASGRRYVVVALINHAHAQATRAALAALLDWVGADLSPP